MRKLGHVRKLWKGILDFTGIIDVFKDKPIKKDAYDVDHFIPWSFVMNDELWNLMPMDCSLNSAKNQYIMYELIHEKPGFRKLYETCYRDNLHSVWASRELYRKGNSREEFYGILEKNMRYVYDSARRQGYQIWMVE